MWVAGVLEEDLVGVVVEIDADCSYSSKNEHRAASFSDEVELSTNIYFSNNALHMIGFNGLIWTRKGVLCVKYF